MSVIHRRRMASIGQAPARGRSRSTSIPDTEAGIREFEIPRMRSYVHEFKADPDVVRLARTVVKLCDAKDRECEMRALFNWTKNHIRYVFDPVDGEVIQTAPSHIADMSTPPALLRAILGDELIAQMRGFGVGFKVLSAPNQMECGGCFTPTIAGPLARSSGDCDEGSTFLATLLAAVGIPSRFRFGGVSHGPDSQSWQHVWVQADDGKGGWVDMDVTEKDADLGWYFPGFTAYGVLEIF